MPKQKIVMPKNPTAIKNKHEVPEIRALEVQSEQKLEEFVHEAIELMDSDADITITATHEHETVKERWHARKSR